MIRQKLPISPIQGWTPPGVSLELDSRQHTVALLTLSYSNIDDTNGAHHSSSYTQTASRTTITPSKDHPFLHSLITPCHPYPLPT